MKENVLKLYQTTAIQLVQQYVHDAEQKFTPLHLFLKNHFKQHSKYGKRDRNAISELVYAYFRVGHTFSKTKTEERIMLGSYLCAADDASVQYLLAQSHLGPFDPHASHTDKIVKAKKFFPDFDPDAFFPFEISLSGGVTAEDYFHSFLQRPVTFIRIAENRHKVLQELEKNGITYEVIPGNESALAIHSSKNLQELDAWKKAWFEIQDLSSQQTIDFMHPQKNEKWWDVCAASGGKSLLLLHKEKNIYILASDVRRNILENYKERIKRSSFLNFETRVLDASQSFEMDKQFDGIICDVPCSGSGTWHRSPENLFFLTEEQLGHYTHLQKNILQNAIAHLKPGKILLYITCSVFKQENEEIIAAVNPASTQLINSFDKGGDCMFVSEIKS